MGGVDEDGDGEHNAEFLEYGVRIRAKIANTAIITAAPLVTEAVGFGGLSGALRAATA